MAMYTVGIAGGSASGKSSFAAALRRTLNARRPDLRVKEISTDSYWRDRSGSPRFVSPSTGAERFDHNHPDALDLGVLLADLNRMAPDTDVLLLEGLMVLHHEALRERMNLRLFIELDADVRALRRMLRDLKGGRTYMDPVQIANYYLESARVGHVRYVEPSRIWADIILRGDADFARTAPLIAAVIQDALTAPGSKA